MNRYFRSLPLGALVALAALGASAQTTAPAAGASAPATLGVTPAEAARANQQAVPRSDTGTLVRTAPSPADRASAALSGTDTGSARQGTAGTGGGTGTDGMRSARADRN